MQLFLVISNIFSRKAVINIKKGKSYFTKKLVIIFTQLPVFDTTRSVCYLNLESDGGYMIMFITSE